MVQTKALNGQGKDHKRTGEREDGPNVKIASVHRIDEYSTLARRTFLDYLKSSLTPETPQTLADS